MFFQWLALGAAAASGITNLVKGISQSVKAKRAERAADKLYAQRPTYEIPTGYTDALSLYKKQAAQTQLPGQGLIEENIQQSSARARSAAERGAVSSAAYGGMASDIYEKELQAIQDLGIKAAEYQAANQEKLAQGYQMMGGQQAMAQDWNKLGAFNTSMNRLESKGATYAQNAANAWQSLGSDLMNFAGTAYAMKMMQGMNGGGGIAGVGQVKSQPLAFPSNTPNIMGTAMGILQGNQPYYTDNLLSYKYPPK